MSANGARGRGLSAQPRIRDAQPALSRTSFVGCHRGRPPVSLWGHPAPPPRTSPAGIFLSSGRGFAACFAVVAVRREGAMLDMIDPRES
jgi:hypothetical protein